MKKILITGATHGIGLAIASKFASQNFMVLLCARNEKDLKDLAAKLIQEHENPNIFIKSTDLSKQEEREALFQFLEKEWGALDVLVNNAGLFLEGGSLDLPESDFHYLMELNLFGVYHLSRLCIPYLKASEGHIFNMSSLAGIQAYPRGGAYGVSKHAVQGLSKSLRMELKPHKVKVTNIIPGATYSRSWEGSGLDRKMFMQPEDVAEVIFCAHQISRHTLMEEVVLRPVLGDL